MLDFTKIGLKEDNKEVIQELLDNNGEKAADTTTDTTANTATDVATVAAVEKKAVSRKIQLRHANGPISIIVDFLPDMEQLQM